MQHLTGLVADGEGGGLSDLLVVFLPFALVFLEASFRFLLSDVLGTEGALPPRVLWDLRSVVCFLVAFSGLVGA